jgi:SsrA-binding protein
MTDQPEIKVVARNRKAQHEYFLQDRFEAGIALMGSEIKSIRAGQMSLQEAYVTIERGEAWLNGAHIAPYQQAGLQNHDPTRSRKLLLHKRELSKLERATAQKGFTIVPLRVYLVRGLAKAEIALAKGKRRYDKRQKIRERDAQRQVDRALSRRR